MFLTYSIPVNIGVGAVMAVDWLPDGKRVVTASWDNTAKLWDAEQSTVIQTLTGINIFIIFATIIFQFLFNPILLRKRTLHV